MTPAPEIDLGSLDFSEIVRPGDTVLWTQASGEPTSLIRRLMAQRHAIGPFRVFTAGSYSGVLQAEHADVVTIAGTGAVGTNRALCAMGVMDVVPCHVSDIPKLLRRKELRADVVLLQVSPEDERGRFSLGAFNGYIQAALPIARTVIAEVNDQAPWTHARDDLDSAAIGCLVRTSEPLPEIAAGSPTAIDETITAHVAGLVDDGATLQLGIGGVPNAVAGRLADRRDLGLHSGVIGDAVMELIRGGAITNARKGVEPGRSVTGGLLGTRALYDFAHRNPELLVEPVTYTHAPEVLARVRRLVSINGAIEVDLTGQVGAEVGAGRYLGTIGGHNDFVRGALASEDGRSIVGLPSRTAKGASRIVARLGSGVVTAPRADVDAIVTEHGVAQLRGKSIPERVRELLAVAHPDDRERLEREAYEAVAGYRPA